MSTCEVVSNSVGERMCAHSQSQTVTWTDTDTDITCTNVAAEASERQSAGMIGVNADSDSVQATHVISTFAPQSSSNDTTSIPTNSHSHSHLHSQFLHDNSKEFNNNNSNNNNNAAETTSEGQSQSQSLPGGQTETKEEEEKDKDSVTSEELYQMLTQHPYSFLDALVIDVRRRPGVLGSNLDVMLGLGGDLDFDSDADMDMLEVPGFKSFEYLQVMRMKLERSFQSSLGVSKSISVHPTESDSDSESESDCLEFKRAPPFVPVAISDIDVGNGLAVVEEPVMIVGAAAEKSSYSSMLWNTTTSKNTITSNLQQHDNDMHSSVPPLPDSPNYDISSINYVELSDSFEWDMSLITDINFTRRPFTKVVVVDESGKSIGYAAAVVQALESHFLKEPFHNVSVIKYLHNGFSSFHEKYPQLTSSPLVVSLPKPHPDFPFYVTMSTSPTCTLKSVQKHLVQSGKSRSSIHPSSLHN
jgi:hypothetical protein